MWIRVWNLFDPGSGIEKFVFWEKIIPLPGTTDLRIWIWIRILQFSAAGSKMLKERFFFSIFCLFHLFGQFTSFFKDYKFKLP